MIFRSFIIVAAVMPMAIFAVNIFSDHSVSSKEIKEKPRNAVNFGGKDLTSAEALEFLSQLAKNETGGKKGPTENGNLPVNPEELGPLILPEDKGPEPVAPEETKIPFPSIIDPPQPQPEKPETILPEEPIKKPETGKKPNGIENPNESGRLRCQDERTKLFIPTARACKDERGPLVCDTLFAPPDESTGRRDPKCDQPGFEDIAKSCRRQCALCCEDMAFACEDDDSGLIDCQKNKDKCTIKKWFDVLSKYCAGTCGLCTKTSCQDKITDCRTMKGLCKNPQHKATMVSQCARSCGFCIPGVSGIPDVTDVPAPSPINNGNGNNNNNCVDVGKNCAERANLCKHPLYLESMNKLCAKTCGTCGTQLPLANSCADTHPRCESWVATGFCTSKYYSADYKKKNCGKSCKLC